MRDGYQVTVQGLIRKRMELSGIAAGLRAQLEQKIAELDTIDAAIRVMRPEITPEDLPDRPAPPANTALRGETFRFLLDLLRRSDRPLNTNEIVDAVMNARGLNSADRILHTLIRKRTYQSLICLRRQGHVLSLIRSKGAVADWRLAVRT